MVNINIGKCIKFKKIVIIYTLHNKMWDNKIQWFRYLPFVDLIGAFRKLHPCNIFINS